jgi:photosynthesis system II assembly factor YCF48-like protein
MVRLFDPGAHRRAYLPGLFTLMLTLCLAPSTVSAGRLFALVDTGEIFASTNGGASWNALAVLPVSDAIGLIAGDTSAELTLATRSGLIYRSANSGVSWNATGVVPAADLVDVQIRPDGALLVLTATGGLWVSTDSGSTFTALAALTGPDYVSLGVGRQGELYVLRRTGAVQQSVDGGTTWATQGAVTVSDAVAIRNLGTNLFVLTATGLISRSGDRGVNWTTVGTLSQVHMSGLTQNVNQLAAITQEGELATSADGTTWNWTGTVNQLSVTALANDIPYAVGIPGEPLPDRIALAARPNPVFGGTPVEVQFTLGQRELVRISLFDMQGRLVRDRAPQFGEAGEQRIQWILGDLPAGTYVLRMTTPSGELSTKVSILR